MLVERVLVKCISLRKWEADLILSTIPGCFSDKTKQNQLGAWGREGLAHHNGSLRQELKHRPWKLTADWLAPSSLLSYLPYIV